jgi:integrase
MGERLTDRMVAKLAKPAAGNVIHFDSEVGGFAIRITAAGARAFVLCYRNRAGRQRRLTIGAFGEWTVGAARAEAKELKRRIDQGDDPLGKRVADRDAPTVADLCHRFIDEHLPKRRASTCRNYITIINNMILPKLGSFKVTEVRYTDIDGLHRKITKDGVPYQANRAVALLSKLFSLAIQWQWRTDNPARGIERNDEAKRERFLSLDELRRLSETLTKYPDQQSADIIRLLLLTGARSGEVKAMRWQDLNVEPGFWVKPSAHTKQKRIHRVPLSAPARELLAAIRAEAVDGAEYVFPGRFGAGHIVDFNKAWRQIRKAARIKDCRVHDFRHTYASILASSGHSLPVIGRLLGHTQAATTHRYAHLTDDPLRLATEKAGEVITNRNGD